MKSNVLYANLKLANATAKTLLAIKDGNGRPQYCKKKNDKGFEIVDKTGEEEKVVFRYTNNNGRRKMDYDEGLISIG